MYLRRHIHIVYDYEPIIFDTIIRKFVQEYIVLNSIKCL